MVIKSDVDNGYICITIYSRYSRLQSIHLMVVGCQHQEVEEKHRGDSEVPPFPAGQAQVQRDEGCPGEAAV